MIINGGLKGAYMISEDDLRLISKQVDIVKPFYKNKRIFLTGGTGFFGKWILEAFLYLNQHSGLNVSITVLSRNPSVFSDNYEHLYNCKYFDFIKGDIRSFKYPEGTFDLIIHAATDASPKLNKENPELMRSTILDGAKYLCEFSKKSQCKRILYTSSGAAYGPQPMHITALDENFNNNINFNKNDAYANAKLESEYFFKRKLECEIVIARCFSFSGPYLPLNSSYAFGNFIRDVLEGNDISLNGDGTAVRSYLYAADLIIWLMKALAVGKNKSIYNIGSPVEITTLQLAKKICSFNDSSSVNILNLHTDLGNIYVPCTRKSQTDLGVEVYTSIDDSISKTLDFYS